MRGGEGKGHERSISTKKTLAPNKKKKNKKNNIPYSSKRAEKTT
jgi:hypothetical protein